MVPDPMIRTFLISLACIQKPPKVKSPATHTVRIIFNVR
jgi:hypothetical protein